MNFYKSRIIIFIGFLGLIIILYGVLVSSIAYVGSEGEKYSILNHFISELGQYKYSKKAIVFNNSLIIGTPFLIYYYIKIVPKTLRGVEILFKWIIITIGISTISVGIFTMDNIVFHLVSALLFFYFCFFASLFFNFYFLVIKKNNIPKYFILSGLLMSIALLLNIVQFHQLDKTMLNVLEKRPNWLLICFTEWLSLFFMVLFFFCSVIFVKNRGE